MQATLIYGTGEVRVEDVPDPVMGLGILLALATNAGSPRGDATQVLAHHVSTALTGSAVLLSLALVVALAVVVPGELARRRAQGGI